MMGVKRVYKSSGYKRNGKRTGPPNTKFSAACKRNKHNICYALKCECKCHKRIT